MPKEIVAGEGVLTWSADERRTDRYGLVVLMAGDHSDECVMPDRSLVGRRGSLVAQVLETRPSPHIGDIFHGLTPSEPEVGERIVFGSGTVFVEQAWRGVDGIGLRPDDGRDEFWLDPKALYRAHNQTVRLLLVPETADE